VDHGLPNIIGGILYEKGKENVGHFKDW